MPTTSAATQHTQRHAAWLAWSLRLRHPFAPLSLLLGVVTVLVTATPAFAPAFRRFFPADAIQRYQQLMVSKARPLVYPPQYDPPKVLPAMPMPTTTPETGLTLIRDQRPQFLTPPFRGREEVAAAPPPAPTKLPCHVIRSGEVAGGEEEWAVEIALDETAVDQKGNVVLPTGTNITGRVRLGRNREPTEWPSVWRLHLPEDNGTVRDLEVTAAYQSSTGGIAVGGTGRLALQTINRIGDRRVDGSVVGAATDPSRPPVSILTNRPRPGTDDLPQP